MKRFGVMAAFLLIGMSMGAPAAVAQVPPPPPLPPVPYVTPPEEAAPVFELIAPTVYPYCGTAALVVFLGGSSVPGSGPTLLNVTTPVFAICGAVPVPPAQLTCLIDVQQQGIINAIGHQAGVPLPLGLHPVGDAVEQTIVIQDKLPPPVKDVGAAQVTAEFLVCGVTGAAPEPGGDYSSLPPPPYTPTPGFNPVPYPPNTVPGFIAQPPAQLPPGPPAVAPPPTTAVGDAVTYAAVWLLPLALLIYGGYFGGALTRDLKLSAG